VGELRPVVGVTTYLVPAAWGAWNMEAALVPADYVRGVVRAGGTPLLVPPGAGIAETLETVDGLVFSGGSDLDPNLYGAEAHPETDGVVRARDEFELELMQAALARDLPVLAICRGSQILNVALGGDLEQHVPDRVGTNVHKEVAGVFAEHDVEVLAETRLGAVLGDRHDVKSHHHQGFARLGEGLQVSARAPDGTVEGLEDPSRRFTVGVLWHPEAGEDLALFEALVAEARAYREARTSGRS
jgi:gamma-glutamyl-gamma-aminobutyrate hydrolase PuuD